MLAELQRTNLGVTYRRLVVDTADLEVAFDIHPLVTVVATGADACESTATMLRHAATTDTAGVHLELDDAAGRWLLMFRPHGAPHQIIDLETGEPLEDPSIIDLRMSEPEPDFVDDAGVVRRLSSLDQKLLWQSAEALVRAEAERDERFQAVEREGDEAPGRSRWSRQPRRLLRRLADSLAEVDLALVRWRAQAEDIDVQRALRLRPFIDACARVRLRSSSLTHMAQDASSDDSHFRPELVADVLVSIMCNPEHPVVVTFPHGELTTGESLVLLDVLAGLDTAGQVIVVTAQDDIIEWGRLEVISRRAAVVDFSALDDRSPVEPAAEVEFEPFSAEADAFFS